ncbi:hypothetical protein DSI35_08610, partial [Mycobacterium tuberculosis]
TTGTAGTGLVAQRGGSASLRNFVVTGPRVGIGVWVAENSTVNLTGASRISITSPTNAQRYALTVGTSMAGVDAIFGTA